MNDWSIPDWGEPFEPAVEVPLLRALAKLVEQRWPHVRCVPDFSTVGCAFVEFHAGDVLVGRACVSAIQPDFPLFSCYLGANEDEFHGRNARAAASVVGHYTDALPLED